MQLDYYFRLIEGKVALLLQLNSKAWGETWQSYFHGKLPVILVLCLCVADLVMVWYFVFCCVQGPGAVAVAATWFRRMTGVSNLLIWWETGSHVRTMYLCPTLWVSGWEIGLNCIANSDFARKENMEQSIQEWTSKILWKKAFEKFT